MQLGFSKPMIDKSLSPPTIFSPPNPNFLSGKQLLPQPWRPPPPHPRLYPKPLLYPCGRRPTPFAGSSLPSSSHGCGRSLISRSASASSAPRFAPPTSSSTPRSLIAWWRAPPAGCSSSRERGSAASWSGSRRGRRRPSP